MMLKISKRPAKLPMILHPLNIKKSSSYCSIKMGKGKRKKQNHKGIKDSIGVIKVIVFVIAVSVFFFLLSISANRYFNSTMEIDLDDLNNMESKASNMDSDEIIIRESAIAELGWYSKGYGSTNKEKLNSFVGGMILQAEPRNLSGKMKALIVPHAGYRYSGQVAAHGFKLVSSGYDTVVIIGSSHHSSFSGASIPNATHYETPLGKVRVSDQAKELIKRDHFMTKDDVHEHEHSVEIEIPFLQYQLDEFEIVPVVIGPSTSTEDLQNIAESIKAIMDEETLIVVSSDFTHYGPNYKYVPFPKDEAAEKIPALDHTAYQYIERLDPEGFLDFLKETRATICGRKPIELLMYILEGSSVNAEVLGYDTSGRMTGDYKNSVSYLSIGFFEEQSFSFVSSEDEKLLLALARQTLENYVRHGKYPAVDESHLSEELSNQQGCFVTLTKNHQLRGCIGHIIPQEKLYECVIDNAINAAANDYRFSKVDESELDEIEVEVSVLTVPEEVEFSDFEELKSKLRPKIDGVILSSGMSSATYLPQVWEQLPEHEDFLAKLCRKAGLSSECYLDDEIVVKRYQAQVFSEHEHGLVSYG